MATSFFGSNFFNGEFFVGGTPIPTVKKGGNWQSKRRRDDEQVLMAVLHSWMQIQERNERWM